MDDDERDALVEAAEVGGRRADDRGEDGGADGDEQGDHHRPLQADGHLGEVVVAGAIRAEPVLGRRSLAQREEVELGVTVLGDERPDDREQDECGEDDEADDGARDCAGSDDV